MRLARLLPEAGEAIDLGDEGARDRIRDWYAPAAGPDWLRCNLVAGVDGSAAGSDGTSETLSNPVDRAVLGVIRSLADVVLIGARTLREEGALVPKRTTLAVATVSGDLAGATAPPHAAEIVVLGPPDAEDRARATLEGVRMRFLPLGAPGEPAAASALVDALRAEGLRSIVCEGGPSLARHLLDAGLVDEVCLTTSPVVAGTGLSVLGTGAMHPLELAALAADDSGALYARWLTPTGAARASR